MSKGTQSQHIIHMCHVYIDCMGRHIGSSPCVRKSPISACHAVTLSGTTSITGIAIQ